ncbi:MAG: arginine repressor [Bacteroidetes bacterium]|nr:arginine repressor [Bacteroidota bacterium]
MSKKLEDIQKRHSLIKNLITTQEVVNQTQLQKVLKQQGVKVTQATLSRDLNELGIIRIPTPNGYVYKIGASGDEATFKYHLADEIISIRYNENLVFIKTFPGRAQGVAVFIDRQDSSEILGTIAGDDTILVAPQSAKKIKKTIEQIKTILGIK